MLKKQIVKGGGSREVKLNIFWSAFFKVESVAGYLMFDICVFVILYYFKQSQLVDGGGQIKMDASPIVCKPFYNMLYLQFDNGRFSLIFC